MRVFSLAEELEKERQKNKKLEDKIKKLEITKIALVPQYSELKEYNAILKDRIEKVISMLELSGSREKISKNFVNIGRKRYDEILKILKGE